MREIPCGTRAFVNEFGINSHLLYFQESLFIVGAHFHPQQEEETIYCAFFDTFIFLLIILKHILEYQKTLKNNPCHNNRCNLFTFRDFTSLRLC